MAGLNQGTDRFRWLWDCRGSDSAGRLKTDFLIMQMNKVIYVI